MKKISTFFKKDPKDLSLVIDDLNPENIWVLEEGSIATRKFDGIACAIFKGEIYKRFDVKKGKKVPDGAIPCQEPDALSGHHPHWLKCDRNKKEDSLFFEGFDNLLNKLDGTYELCGEKISTERFISKFNVEKVKGHQLIKHSSQVIELEDLTFEGLKKYLSNTENDIEGIVFHHKTDGRMCKIRKKDFGIIRQEIKVVFILFPSEPFNHKEVDSSFKIEFEAANSIGFKTYLFDHDELTKKNLLKTNLPIQDKEGDITLILRGWMLKEEEYTSLFGQLYGRGYALINKTSEYVNGHHLPASFDKISHLTSKTWWTNGDYKSDSKIDWKSVRNYLATDLIIKDYVKSEKSNPDLFILPMTLTEEEFCIKVQEFVEARGKLFNKGIVLKQLVSLKRYGKNTNEWRFFYLNKKFVYLNLNVESEIELPRPGSKEFEIWHKVALTIDSNFFTIDVAEKEDGSWMILEIGDGQVSGLPIHGMPLSFFIRLKENLNG